MTPVILLIVNLCTLFQGSLAYDAFNSGNTRLQTRSVTVATCSADQRAVVDKCLALYDATNELLLEFEPERLLFSDPVQRERLKKVCRDYEKVLDCEEVLNSRASKACLKGNNDDGIIYTYACELLLPIADDHVNAECWNRTAECVPSIKMKMNANTPNMHACKALLSAYRQFQCVEQNNEHKCTVPEEEVLQRALGETLYLMVENQCIVLPEEGTTTASVVETATSAVEVAQPYMADRCKKLQEYDPVFCIFHIGQLNEYFAQIMYSFTIPGQEIGSQSLQDLCRNLNPLMECLKSKQNNSTYGCYAANLADQLAGKIVKFCLGPTAAVPNRTVTCRTEPMAPEDPCNAYSDKEEQGIRAQLCAIVQTGAKYISCIASRESPTCDRRSDNDIGFIASLVNEARKGLQCVPVDEQHPEDLSDQMDGPVSTVSTDETTNLPLVNCTLEDAEIFEKCFANFSQYGFHPISVVDNVSEIDQACTAFNQFFKCRRKVKCRPPIDGAIYNMFYLVCGTRLQDYKRQRDCLATMSNTHSVNACIKNSDFKINQLIAMNSQQLCEATAQVINCTNGRVEQRCGVDSGDFQFLLLQSFAKGANISCPIESRPKVKESLITFPINCTEEEVALVKTCADQFNGMTEKLKDLVSKGLPHVLKSVDALNEVFYDGCGKMRLFDQCWNSSISHDSSCMISSCLINVGLTVCNSNDGVAPLRDQLKCAFSLVAEPDFNKCFKSVPKLNWNNPAQMGESFPKFISCIREPLTKKCGENAVRLVRSLINEVLLNPYDSSCIVNFQLLREPFKTAQINMRLSHEIQEALDQPITIASIEEELKQHNMTLYPQLEDPRPICSTPEFINQGSCHQEFMLADVDMEVIFVNSEYLLPNLCLHLADFVNCTHSKSCRYPDNEAWENLLIATCNDYRTQMTDIGKCLSDLSHKDLLATCDRGKPRQGRLHCPWGGSFYLCAIPMVASHCSLDLAKTMRTLYSIYARPYGTDCILDDQLIYADNRTDTATAVPIPTISTELEKPFCDGETILDHKPCWSVYPSNIHLHDLFLNSSGSRPYLCQSKALYSECIHNATCRMAVEEAIDGVLFTFCNWPLESFQEFGNCVSEQLTNPANDSCREMLHKLLDNPEQNDGQCPFDNLRNLLVCTDLAMRTTCSIKSVRFTHTLYNTLIGRFAPHCTLPSDEEPMVEIGTELTVGVEETKATQKQPACNALSMPSEGHIENCLSVYDNGIRIGQLLLGSKYEFPDLCLKLEEFTNCTDRQYCRTVKHDSLRDLMSRFCKLEAATFNPIATCTKSFYTAQLDLPDGHQDYCDIADPYLDSTAGFDVADFLVTANNSCPAFGETLQCISQRLAENCSYEALKLTYDLYNSYASYYGSNCVLDVHKVQRPLPACTSKEDKAFNACEEELLIHGLDRRIFLIDTNTWTNLCRAFTVDYKKCMANLKCVPQPYTKAFQHTMSFLCFNESIRTTYSKPIACLASAVNSIALDQCKESYDDIIWSGVIGASGNPCSKLNEILSCVARAVLEPCGEESVKLLYMVNGIFMEQYDSTCNLEVPELTTTAPEAAAETTDAGTAELELSSKVEEETTTIESIESEATEQTQETEITTMATELTKTTPEPIFDKTTPTKKPQDTAALEGEDENDDGSSGSHCASWNVLLLLVSIFLATSINFNFNVF